MEKAKLGQVVGWLGWKQHVGGPYVLNLFFFFSFYFAIKPVNLLVRYFFLIFYYYIQGSARR
jgi:hypothetical protein